MEDLSKAPVLESIVVNLTGKTRRATLNGRNYIVAPLSLIVSGVLNGSKGALYYPAEEVHRDPSVWNHVPIVVNHPSRNGSPVSARDPDVLANFGIGYVFKSTAKSGRLTAEGWFDIEHTKRVDNRILEALEQGRPIELSTGLFTDNEPTKGVHNESGRAYDFIARNYRPDHLAILPDQVGACSVNDGCGVLVNQDTKNAVQKFWDWLLTNRDWPQAKRDKTPAEDFAGPHESFPITSQADVDAAAHLVGKAADPEAVKARIKAIAKKKGLKVPEEWTANQDDVASSELVSNKGEDMSKLNDADKKKLIDGLITNCACQANNVWSETDRDMLENMTDEQLAKLAKQRAELTANTSLVAAVAKELDLKPDAMTANTVPAALAKAAKGKKKKVDDQDDDDSNDEPMTNAAQEEAEWLKKQPRRVQENYAEAANVVAKQKAELIGKMVANLKDEERADAIAKFSEEKIDTLRLIANMIPEAPKKEEPVLQNIRTPAHYLGAGAPLVNAGYTPQDKKQDEEPFLCQTINYAEEVANRSKSA